jgi:O-antigen/teichoic acid export membrane protein
MGFMMVPIATLRLDAAHYGVFALVVSVASLGAALAALGAGYRLAEVFSTPHLAEHQQVVSAQLLASTVMVVFCTGLILGIWYVGRGRWPILSSVPTVGIVLAAASTLGTVWWGVATEVLTLTRRARVFAAVSISQAILAALGLLIALFVFKWTDTALFISAFVGSMTVAAGSLIALRAHLTTRITRSHWRSARAGANLLSLSTLTEAAYLAIERALLASWANLTHLGLYAHSQQYRTLVAMPIKAVARSSWPDSLVEARDGARVFRKTGLIWSAMHLIMAEAALGAGAVGREIIGLMTHGKFTEAAPWASAGIAILLTQHLGKPQTAVVYALGLAGPHAKIIALSTFVAAAAALIAIPVIGVWGAVVAALAQQFMLRASVRVLAASKARTPFQDRCALIGLGCIGVQFICEIAFAPALLARIALFFALSAALALLARDEIRLILSTVRRRG